MDTQIVEQQHDEVIASTKNKYSFNLEKLKLAQASLPASPTFNPSCPKASKSPSRPPLNRSKSSSYLKPTTRRTKKSACPSNDHLSTADAQRFLRLPPKVQRRQFTRDEQIILSGHCESATLHPAGQIFSQSRRGSDQSASTLRPSTASTEQSLYYEAKQEPSDSAVDMDDSMMEKLRWMDENEIDLHLDDYHTHVIEASSPRPSWSSHHRPSFRRNLTSPIPLASPGSLPTSRRPSTNPTSSPITDSFPTMPPTIPKTNNRETMNFLPIHQNRPSMDSSSTRHHQDPEARLKLRVYLASDSKFDEAIEFGFPSLEETTSIHDHASFPIQGNNSTRPSLSSHHYPTAPAAAGQTFFDDSSPSVFNAFGFPGSSSSSSTFSSDAASLPDLDMPRTPSDAVFRNTHRLPPTTSSSTSTTSNPLTKFTFPPPVTKTRSTSTPTTTHPSLSMNYPNPTTLQSSLRPKIRYLAPSPIETGNREMTLRMTLTRPDLRTGADDMGYGEMGDPLALSELPPARNGRTLWDREEPKVGVVRRVLRKFGGGRC